MSYLNLFRWFAAKGTEMTVYVPFPFLFFSQALKYSSPFSALQNLSSFIFNGKKKILINRIWSNKTKLLNL